MNQSKSQRNEQKDAFNVLVDKVMEPQIRRMLYEWDPMERENNGRFVSLFQKLKTLIPDEVYCNLMRHLIVPRLNHLLSNSENEVVTDPQTADCIISWSFLFKTVDTECQ